MQASAAGAVRSTHLRPFSEAGSTPSHRVPGFVPRPVTGSRPCAPGKINESIRGRRWLRGWQGRRGGLAACVACGLRGFSLHGPLLPLKRDVDIPFHGCVGMKMTTTQAEFYAQSRPSF